MTKYLIDTNLFIDVLKGKRQAILQLQALQSTSVVSFVTVGELMQGSRNKNELKEINKLMELFEVDYAGPEVIIDALALLQHYQPKIGLQLLDSIIASTAKNKEYTLVTTDKKHFAKIREISLL